MHIELTPLRVYRCLLILIGLLLIANSIAIVLVNFTIHDHAWGMISLFSFNIERNVPTFYAALTILVAAFLLAAVGRRHQSAKEASLPWYFLGLVFLFISFDEVASLHERLIRPARDFLKTGGALYFAWVIPYGVAVLLLALVYIPFLKTLPRRTATIFVVSGVLFVGGAVGMELIGGNHYELHGPSNLGYGIIFTLEELLEKVGMATFVFGILDYMTRQFGPIRVQLS